MDDTKGQPDQLFMQLVLSLQMGAWQQLGKIASPISGKVERDLTMAKMSIDMLSMIQGKTRGNLTSEETRMLDHILYELRLNYVDESKRGEEPEKGGPTEGSGAGSREGDEDSGGDEESPSDRSE